MFEYDLVKQLSKHVPIIGHSIMLCNPVMQQNNFTNLHIWKIFYEIEWTITDFENFLKLKDSERDYNLFEKKVIDRFPK